MTEEYEQYKYEQARKWLEYVRQLGVSCDTALRAVEFERGQLENLKGVDYSLEHVSGSRTPPDMAGLVDSIRDNIRHYCANAVAWTEQRRDAYDRLNGLESRTEAKALQMRYCMNNSWAFVCGAMNYTEGGMMKLRKQAIIHAYEVMPLEKRDPKYSALE